MALVGPLHALSQLSQEVVITKWIPDPLAGLVLLQGWIVSSMPQLTQTGNFSLFLSWHLRFPFSTDTSVHYFHTAAGQYWLLDSLSGCRCSRSIRADSYCVCLNRYYLRFSCKTMLCSTETILCIAQQSRHTGLGLSPDDRVLCTCRRSTVFSIPETICISSLFFHFL